jgi:hypothetical protein
MTEGVAGATGAAAVCRGGDAGSMLITNTLPSRAARIAGHSTCAKLGGFG